MMNKHFNQSYPLQEHLDVDVSCEILEFPSRDTKKCQHQRVAIDAKANELECRDCGVKVNAVMWIKDSIHYFKALQERSLKQSEAAKADLEELKGRAKTKCDNCGKMTGIKLKNYKFRVVK